MESRLQPPVLILLCSLLPALSPLAQATDAPNPPENPVLDKVIQPGIERRNIEASKIDTENFELGLFAGVMSVEDFGTNNVYGMRMAYHITEDFFLEANYAITTVEPTSAETLVRLNLLDENQRQLSYYSMDFGYNLLPGQQYLGKWAFNSQFYILAGAGNTQFANTQHFTYNFGAGLRLFATDWLAIHADFRNYIFTHNLFFKDKEIQNLETSLGLTLFF